MRDFLYWFVVTIVPAIIGGAIAVRWGTVWSKREVKIALLTAANAICEAQAAFRADPELHPEASAAGWVYTAAVLTKYIELANKKERAWILAHSTPPVRLLLLEKFPELRKA